MSRDLVWVAGEVRAARDAKVSVRDRSFRYGDGVFATLSWRSGRLLDAPAQLARLALGCETLGLAVPPELSGVDRFLQVLACLDIEQRRAVVVRAQVSAGVSERGYGRSEAEGSRAFVELSAPPPARRLSVATAAPDLRLPGPAIPGVKSCSALSAVLAARAAAERGVHEILRLDDGRLTEASAANLFWLADGTLRTPSAALPLYPGVTRSLVLEVAREAGLRVEEGHFPPSELSRAEGVFLTNAVRGMERVHRLDGRRLGWPEELRQIARALRRLRFRRGVRLRGSP
ncbi:MAG: aminotransferase class IV [Gemmatimonadota bacterium]